MTTTDFMTETSKTISDSFQKSADVGVRFFDDATKFWTEQFSRSGETSRSQWEKLTDEMMPFGRKNVERWTKLFDDQTKRNLEAMKSAFEFRPTSDPKELHDRSTQFFKTQFEQMRHGADAFVKTANESMQAFTECTKSCTHVDPMSDKAKRPATAAK